MTDLDNYKVFKYRLVATPNEFGVIYIDTNAKKNNITIKKNNKDFTSYTYGGSKVTVAIGDLAKDDLFELEYEGMYGLIVWFASLAAMKSKLYH